MLISRFPIKYILPVLLLIFTSSAIAMIYVFDRRELAHEIELRMLSEAHQRIATIQGSVELLQQQGQYAAIKQLLSTYSALEDNITLLATDETNRIIATKQLADLGKALPLAHPEVVPQLAEQVIRERSIKTDVDPEKGWIDSYASICSSGGSLRQDRCGLLYHRLDLAHHHQSAQQPLNTQLHHTALTLFLAALLLGLIIHFLLFRRTEQLALAVSRYTHGERTVRSDISGRDEIGRLAQDIDAMMAKIEKDEEELLSKEQRLTTLFDSVRDPIVVTKLNGEISSFNRAAEQLFVYSSDEVQGKNINILMPQPMRQAHDGHMENYHAGEQQHTVIGKGRELIACNKFGQEFPVEVTITELRRKNDIELIGVIRDISARKLAEEGLRLSRQVFESASEGIMITDADSTIIDVNPAYELITGYSREEMLGEKPSKISSRHHDTIFFQKMWADINDKGSWCGEIWDRRRNGEPFPKWLSINAIKNDRGEVSHYVGIFSDISAQKAIEEELEQLAYYDPLTKLPNRTLYRNRLQQEITKCRRTEQGVALLFIDLDRFKQVNDTLGHDVGDELLIAVAQRLNDCVRSSDTVARLGGDEFTVILSDITGQDGVAKVAQGIITKLQTPFELLGHDVQIGGSIGIALFPEHADSYDTLTKKADIAMYHAKSIKGSVYMFYSEGLE